MRYLLLFVLATGGGFVGSTVAILTQMVRRGEARFERTRSPR